MDRREIENVLEESEFFQGMAREHIEKVAQLCKWESYETGETVFAQGDLGNRLFIIHQGHISLERALDMGLRKGRVVIEILGRGRVLGCWSTLLGEPHKLMSSATCQKPTTLVSMKGSELRNLMVNTSDLGLKVMERFCFLLRDRIQAAYGALEKI